MQHLYLVQHNLASAVSIVFAASVGSVAFEAYEASVVFPAYSASIIFAAHSAFAASIIFADTIALWSFGTLLGQYIPASGRYKIW